MQLGVGTRARHIKPIEVDHLRGERIRSVAAAGDFSGTVNPTSMNNVLPISHSVRYRDLLSRLLW